jgi:hypothetical protein
MATGLRKKNPGMGLLLVVTTRLSFTYLTFPLGCPAEYERLKLF